MSGTNLLYALLAALVLLFVWYVWRWYALERGRTANEPRTPQLFDLIVGFITNFFDTLGIGSFATTTAALKVSKRVADENIPGTLNAAYALPTLVQALIFIYLLWERIDPVTLVLMIAAAVLGSWLGAGIVAKLPRRGIQLGLGSVLLVAAGLFLSAALGWSAVGGTASGLTGRLLIIGIVANFVLGALMTIGLGLYGPCLILVSLLGMDTHLAFPIMMGSCAFLMPACAVKFIRLRKYDARACVGLALGAIPGVLIAAFIVKEMDIRYLRWLVVVVALYASILLLMSAIKGSSAETVQPTKAPTH